MAENTEHRTVQRADFEARVQRVNGSPAKIVGYAAVFGTEADIGGQFREVVRAGAFAKSLAAGVDVRALFNHDPNLILGRRSAGTLKLIEDAKGLRYEITPPDTGAARDLLVSIERGDVTGSSFGFRVIKDEWRGRDHRELVEVEPYDVSPVTFPAYESTVAGVA